MSVTCDAPTSHFSSGRVLLEHYDTDNDGKLTPSDKERAFEDMMEMGITKAEYEFVDSLFAFPASDQRYGNINAKCPIGERPPPCGNYGDVDDDGYVTPDDATMVAQYTVGTIELTPEQLKRADVGGDGKVTMSDSARIQQYALGMVDTFPVCEAPEKVTVTFVTKKEDATELKGVSVYVNEVKKGETALAVDLKPGELVTVKLVKVGYETQEFDYLVPDADETVTKTMVLAPVDVITCDNNPYASLGLDTGCKLLLHYNVKKDGMIDLDELNQSYSDYENGIITEGEFDFVSDAYIYGGINVVCPGCYIPPPKKTVTFESVPMGAGVAID